MSEPKTPLSASRIKTVQSCSWLYWAKYHLNLPDPSNDGAKRGSICHLIFELLGEKNRRDIYKSILKSKDVFSHSGIKRLILKHAKKLQVDDKENIESIKEMILNGLNYDFYGDTSSKPTEALSEKDFEITVNDEERDVKYKIKGFIDKLFLYKKNKYALIRDFKTSKKKFIGKEVTDNLQDYMYSLAVKHLYPEYKKRESEFLFLKFDLDKDLLEKSDGAIRMESIGDDDIEGFEYQLTAIQDYIDNFSENDAIGNFAASQPYPTDKSFSGPLQCGFAKEKGQLKVDGTLMWHCPAKFAFDYYVILNQDGQTIKSYSEEEFSESLVPDGFTFEKRFYAGCPKHQKTY